MARPAKSARLLHECSQTKEEINQRIKAEEKLKGDAKKISPPTYLNTRQKKIFKNIVSQLEQSGILGNLDVYILSTCSIALDRIQTIETMINADGGLISDKDLRMSNDKYTKDFFRCCNELSLSPQSRAKIGNIALQNDKEKQDPLLKVLGSKR